MFLSYNRLDKPAVEAIAAKLQDRGIETWLDQWNLIAGEPWQDAVERALTDCETCAVFVGPSGQGPWQNNEMRAALDLRMKAGGARRRVIPVLLPRAKEESIPLFLAGNTFVLFESLEDEEALYQLLCGIKGVMPGRRDIPSRQPVRGQCPYRGLDAFDIADGPLFFGRNALVQKIIARVSDELNPGGVRLVGILGASGSGKSSLARAGVLYQIQEGALPGSKTWPVIAFKPAANPLESLSIELLRHAYAETTGKALAEMIDGFLKDERRLHLSVAAALLNQPAGTRLALLVDQFEEVFTVCRDEKAREAFIKNLLYAAAAGGPSVVLLTLRADFYGECAGFVEFASALESRHVLVGGMAEGELRAAIEEPARIVNVDIEPGLADVLVREASGQAGALPLLQYTLMRLWEECAGSGRLSLDAYRGIGGLSGALHTQAESVYTERLSNSQPEISRRIFLRLAEAQPDGRYTRVRTAISQLYPASAAPKQVKDIEEVVGILAGPKARLLTVSSGQAAGPTVEVAHEELFRAWKRYSQWLEEDRAFLNWRRTFGVGLSEWLRLDRDPDCLLRGALQKEAEESFAQRAEDFTETETAFLRSSRETVDAETRAAHAAQRRRYLLIAGQIAASIALVFVIWFFVSRAQVTGKLLAKARELRASDGKLALLMAYQANLRRDGPETLSALYTSLEAATAAEIEGHEAIVISFSYDGNYLATGEADGNVALLDADVSQGDRTYSELRRLPNEERLRLDGPVAAVCFSKANVLAAGTLRGIVGGFNPDTGALLPPVLLKQSGITSIAISPDGTRILTGAEAGEIRLWSAAGAGLEPYRIPAERVSAVTFSGDGRRFAAGGSNGVFAVWDTGSPAPIWEQKDPDGTFSFLALPADGRGLITASRSGKARQWDLETKREERVFLPPTGLVRLAGVAEDGSRLATPTDGNSIVLWDTESGNELFTISSDAAPVRAIAFSFDAKRLAVARTDGTARVMELDRNRVRARVQTILRRDPRFPFTNECREAAGGCSGL